MPFKKLNTPLKDVLEHLKFEEATPFQKMVIPRIKGGANVFAVGGEGSGKTTALIINTLQKLKSTASGDNPRALIFVKDKKAALELEEEFNRFIQQMDLRVCCVYEEGDKEKQRDTIYYGVDIVIATPLRLNKLYHLNGINLTDLNLLIIEDANIFRKENFASDIIRITESLPRCQFLVFSTEYDDKLKSLKNSFMEISQVINI